MKCPKCKKQVSTTDIVNLALVDWKTKISKDKVDMLLDISLPISSQQLDIAAFTYSYHLEGGCYLEEHPFWGNKDIQTILLRLQFDEHKSSHSKSCYKKVSLNITSFLIFLKNHLC